MKILVTGGSGFIGKHISERLIRDGHDVTVVSTGTEPIIPGVKKILYMGLNGIDWSYIKDQEIIIHQMANNDTRCQDEREMNLANVSGPKKLFEQAAKGKCKKFIYASSTAVYGNQPAPYFEETTKIDPLTCYAKSKVLFENWIKEAGDYYNIPVIGFRYCNVYGPGEDHKQKRMSMIGQLLRTMAKGIPPKLFTDGSQRRDWIYVKDVVEANIKAIAYEKSDIFNLGSGKSCTFNEIVEIINVNLNTNIKPEYITCDYENEYQNFTECNIEKIGKELGFFPDFDIKKGIKTYINDFFS